MWVSRFLLMFMMILFPRRAQRVTVLTLALVMEHHGVSELGDVYVARLLVHEMVLVKRMLSRMK